MFELVPARETKLDMTMPFNDNHKPNGERGGEMPRLLYIRLFLWAVIFCLLLIGILRSMGFI